MKYDHTKASWRACQLSWCLALSLRHARWHDLAVAEYPRPPSEAYSERDAPLKHCQIILLGVYQSKSPLGRSHCITVDAIPRRGNLNVRTVIIWHPVSGTLGKQTCSELTQSVKHWEAQTPLSKVQGSHAFRMMKFLDFSRTFPGPNLVFQGPSRTKTTINTHKYSLPSNRFSLLLHKQGKQWFNGTYQEISMNNISEICVNNIQVSH